MHRDGMFFGRQKRTKSVELRWQTAVFAVLNADPIYFLSMPLTPIPPAVHVLAQGTCLFVKGVAQMSPSPLLFL